MKAAGFAISFLLCALSLGCGSGEAASADVIRGRIVAGDAADVPAAARLEILWSVSATSPDYQYAFGETTTDGESFQLPLSPPPDKAVNSGELGVGFLILLPEDQDIPRGEVEGRYWDDDSLDILGAAPQYAVIYRASEQQTFRSWPETFPMGVSCGKAVFVDDESDDFRFDYFEPVPCDEVVVQMGDLSELEIPNWT